MTTIALFILFILQIIGFYFLALLYTKVSSFNNLEKKQRQLMTEMDNSIAVYLAELKEENERLIKQLAVQNDNSLNESTHKGQRLQTEKETSSYEVEKDASPLIKAPKMPINLALQSYKEVASKVEKVEDDDERTVIFNLHDEGKTIQEIAKKLGKGETEVELLLKFR